MKKAVCVAVLMCVVDSFGTIMDFNLKDDESIYSLLDNKASGSVTNSGLIVTFTSSAGNMNRTSGGFGINGPGTDDTDALNAGQYIDLSFSQDVIFTNLSVSSWGASDAGEVQLGPSYVSQGSIDGSSATPYGFAVDTGETVRILATADSGETNGFSVDCFSVVAIPEPAVISLLGLGGGIVMLVRRRK
jgi:hypothetical protein